MRSMRSPVRLVNVLLPGAVGAECLVGGTPLKGFGHAQHVCTDVRQYEVR